MFTNINIQLLFLLTATAIVTWWYILELLNPFIKNAFAIITCALDVILTFFLRRIKQRIHMPPLIKALFYLMFGTAVFIFDHIYGVKLFESDETNVFYHINFQGTTYWISQLGVIIGGFLISLGALYVFKETLKGLNKLLDRSISISIVVLK